MVTVTRIGGQVEPRVSEIRGLSTDVKPISDELFNGSEYYEMDSKKLFLYDAENKQWLEQ